MAQTLGPSDPSPAEPAPPAPEPQLTPEAAAAAQRAKWLKFLIGFFGWFVLNTLGWLAMLKGESLSIYGLALNILVLPVNLIVLLFLAIWRPGRWAALGMLAAVAANFFVSLLLGMQMKALCAVPFLVK